MKLVRSFIFAAVVVSTSPFLLLNVAPCRVICNSSFECLAFIKKDDEKGKEHAGPTYKKKPKATPLKDRLQREIEANINVNRKKQAVHSLANNTNVKDGRLRWSQHDKVLDIGVDIGELNDLASTENEGDDDSSEETLGSLLQLTKFLDTKLSEPNTPAIPAFNVFSDPMGDLLMSNEGIEENFYGDWKWQEGKVEIGQSTTVIAILLGKELVRNQITLEYCSRIRALVRMMKDESFSPSVIGFCGDVGVDVGYSNDDFEVDFGGAKGQGGDSNRLDSSKIGYFYFMHLVESFGVDVGGIEIVLAAAGGIERIVDVVTGRCRKSGRENEEYLHFHFVMISCEYHLGNINDVHRRSPSQSSLLSFQKIVSSQREKVRAESFLQLRTPSTEEQKELDVVATWSFKCCAYPFLYVSDVNVAFLARCYLLGEELVPMHVNLKAVIEKLEFFQRDNYVRLKAIRRSLVESVESLYKPVEGRSDKLNLSNFKTPKSEEILASLEKVVASLGKVVDVTATAGNFEGFTPPEDYEVALEALEIAMKILRKDFDPDRPMMASDWTEFVREGSSEDQEKEANISVNNDILF